jgi:cellulose 1,4-beta-cellobiosidase
MPLFAQYQHDFKMNSAVALFSILAVAVRGQQIGTQVAEVHPLLTTAKCVKGGVCPNQASSIVLDSN